MKIQTFLSASPLFTLFSTYEAVIEDFQRQLARENVHFLQALIVTSLFFEERPVRPGELASVLGARKSNLSHALRGLERLKLLERSNLDTDARAYLFTLTKDGRKKAQRLIKLFDMNEDRIESFPGTKGINAKLKTLVQAYQGITN